MKWMFLVVLAISMSGCASITKGKTQQVNFRSVPEGAQVKVNGYNLCKTPCMTQMSRSTNGFIEISAEGYPARTQPLTKHVNAAFWVNILIGGIPGWIVDGATGAMWTFDPENIVWIFDREKAKSVFEPWAHADDPDLVTTGKLLAMDKASRGEAVAKLRPWEKISAREWMDTRLVNCTGFSLKKDAEGKILAKEKEAELLRQLCDSGIDPTKP